MRAALTDSATFGEALLRTGALSPQLVGDEGTTIRTPDTQGAQRSSEVVSRRLSVLTGPDAELVVRQELNAGGMGTIFLAEQASLGRDVAVKRSLADGDDLVIEARVAGQLEHPNIVPVYMLGVDGGGAPLLVMKHIEGRSWRDILKAEGVSLARDLDVLVDVCHALHFAHDRGVIHRDIKPGNVMVGRFGEVYLVDWGIAAGFGARAPDGLPRATDVRDVVGTPAYMAPEMAYPEGGMDARTDVFVVGAVLFELLTGNPPHKRGGFIASLHAAHTCGPLAFPQNAPEELVEICTRATQRHPADRYQSIADFRDALRLFQSHAAARALCDGAEERLTELAASVGTKTPESERDLQRAFTEARFGFIQALRAWQGSQRARMGLERTLTLMVRYELSAGRVDAALLIARDFEVVPDDLREDLERHQRQREKDAARVDALQAFARENDHRTAQRERAIVALFAGCGWFLVALGLQVVSDLGIYTSGPLTLAAYTGAVTVGIVVAAIVVPRLRQTAASRALVTMMTATEASLCVVYVIGAYIGVPLAPMLAIGQLMLTMTGAHLAAFDRRLWSAVVISMGSVAPLLVWPAFALAINGVALMVVFLEIARRWLPRSQAPQT